MPKTRRLSDAALVRRSQQGDRRAFSALLGRYDRRLRGLAHALLLDQGQMDLALGTGYMRAWRDVVRLGTKDDVAAWLYRATYNACIDELRRSEGEQTTPPASGLAEGLATLSAAHRVAVVLVDREGFPSASAARIMGLPVSELAVTLDQAREQLTPYLPEPATAPAPTETDDRPVAGTVPNGDVPAPAPEAGSDEAGDAPAPLDEAVVGRGNGNGRGDDAEGGAGHDARADEDELVREPAAVAAGHDRRGTGGTGGTDPGAGDGPRDGSERRGSGSDVVADADPPAGGDRAGDDEVTVADTSAADPTGTPPVGGNGTGDGAGDEGAVPGPDPSGNGGPADDDRGPTATGGDGAASDGDRSTNGNGNGDRAEPTGGRGRRARKRAKHAARHQAGRADPADGADGDTG